MGLGGRGGCGWVFLQWEGVERGSGGGRGLGRGLGGVGVVVVVVVVVVVEMGGEGSGEVVEVLVEAVTL